MSTIDQHQSLYKLPLSKLKALAQGLRITIDAWDTKRTLIRKILKAR